MVAACRQFALYGSTALTMAGYFFPKGRHGERSRTMRPLSILQHLCTRPSPLLQGKVRGVPQPNSPWIEMVLVIVCLVGLAHMLDDLFLEADRTEEFLAIGAAHSRMLQLRPRQNSNRRWRPELCDAGAGGTGLQTGQPPSFSRSAYAHTQVPSNAIRTPSSLNLTDR